MSACLHPSRSTQPSTCTVSVWQYLHIISLWLLVPIFSQMNPLYFLRTCPLNRSQSTVCVATQTDNRNSLRCNTNRSQSTACVATQTDLRVQFVLQHKQISEIQCVLQHKQISEYSLCCNTNRSQSTVCVATQTDLRNTLCVATQTDLRIQCVLQHKQISEVQSVSQHKQISEYSLCCNTNRSQSTVCVATQTDLRNTVCVATQTDLRVQFVLQHKQISEIQCVMQHKQISEYSLCCNTNRSQSTVCVATQILSGNLTKYGAGVPAFSSVGNLSPVFLQTVKCHDLLRHLSFCFVCFRITQEACNVGRIVTRYRLSSVVFKMLAKCRRYFSIRYWNDRNICLSPSFRPVCKSAALSGE